MTITPLWQLHLYPQGHTIVAHPPVLDDEIAMDEETSVEAESERCYWEETPAVAEGWEAMARLFEEHPELLADEESYYDYRAREEQAILL